MKQRLPSLLALSAAVGVVLAWACVSLVGVLAAFVSEHRFFGLPVYPVMVVEAFLAWVPLSLVAGYLIGTLRRDNAVAMSVTTAVIGFLSLLATSVEYWWANRPLSEAVETVAFAFLTAGVLMLLATPSGAFIAMRRKRSNPSFKRTPDGAA